MFQPVYLDTMLSRKIDIEISILQYIYNFNYLEYLKLLTNELYFDENMNETLIKHYEALANQQLSLIAESFCQNIKLDLLIYF